MPRPVHFLILLVSQFFCPTLAEMLCFPESPSLHRCGFSVDQSRHFCRQMHADQQPYSFLAWKAGAGSVYFSFRAAPLVSAAQGWRSEATCWSHSDLQQICLAFRVWLIRQSKPMRQVQGGSSWRGTILNLKKTAGLPCSVFSSVEQV